ncbi:YcdB/YcdC domain-containing protein [Clostridium sp. OS1-26]|uniref:YcdB/YcdC domain-containing protein n=1 Tax=Clostridium sp. OS1-26 TaxID=3070681 RepID=UPI0027E11A62|nr:YcdB/YcdC domain-containing protein [Clostridium sp. OS1-26]WML34803.1 S-layer homology domain-containing protein [Clostridium sp. OS1-26]
MTSKKTYAIILTALISLSLVSPVYAQETSKALSNTTVSNTTTVSAINESNSKISKDEAKVIAKKILKDYFDFSIDDTKYQTNVNFTPDYQYSQFGANNKNYIWQINWNSHDQEKDVSVNVSVDATNGKVTNVDVMTSLRGQASGIATLTEDQAKEVAVKFLNKINPQEFSQCKLVKNDSMTYGWKGDPTSYNFNYCRVVNNIPFSGNFLNVTVDSITGKIRSYGFRWNDYQLPSQDGIISQEKANQIFKDNLNLDLKYVPYRDEYGYDTKTKTTKIAYMPDMSSGVNIDAKEGKMLDYSNTSPLDKKVTDLDENQKKSFIGSYKSVQKLDKELTSNAAETIMKSLIKEIYGDGYDIEATSYQDNNGIYGSGLTCWSSHFIKKGANNDFADQGQITIDSLTGQLVSINRFNPVDKFGSNDDNSKPKITWEQAYSKSIDIVKKYFPDKVKDIDTKQTYIQRTEYYNNVPQFDRLYGFNFNRLVNGLSYQDDSISVNFNSSTGEIANIDSRWTQSLNAPSANGVISKSDAQNIFFNTYRPQLQYTLFNTSKDPKNSELGVKLVYSVLDGLQYRQLNGIDAFKGKFIDYNGQEIDNNFEAFKAKIKGSPVEKELSILASLGIIDTKDFDLNKQITRADLVKILVNAKGYRPYMLETSSVLKINYGGSKDDETYKYLQMAVSYGMLDNSGDFNANEKVTREEAIKSLVKLLGYDKLAQAKGIFTLSYSDANDITPANTGYVAISKGLGLTNDTDNKFRPKDQITISDLAVNVYRALNSLRGNGY